MADSTFDHDSIITGSRTIEDVSHGFDTEATDLRAKLDEALAKVQTHGSDPAALSDYQAILSDYTLYRNAQSNTTKAIKDIDSATISNFR
jgi:type III secretion protein F